MAQNGRYGNLRGRQAKVRDRPMCIRWKLHQSVHYNSEGVALLSWRESCFAKHFTDVWLDEASELSSMEGLQDQDEHRSAFWKAFYSYDYARSALLWCFYAESLLNAIGLHE